MRKAHLLLLAGVLLAAPMALGARDHEKGKGDHEHSMAGMLKESLGLNDAQVKKLESLHEEHEKAQAPLRKKLRSALSKLRWQLDDEAGDKALQSGLDELAAARKALQGEHEKFMDSAAAVLTPTQRAKFAVSMGGAFSHGKGRMQGMHGMHGGPGKGDCEMCRMGGHEGGERRMGPPPRDDDGDDKDDEGPRGEE